MATSGLAQRVANLITEYLGPSVPRAVAAPRPGGATATVPAGTVASAPGAANLTALRSLLDQDPATYNSHVQLVVWKLREALRTEFFKIRYPHPPSARLLHLVATSEVLFADTSARPFFFPGARVAVPTETGTHRAGTSLQLRFKKAPDGRTVTEALLHLDGPDGGGFQWVQAQVLSLLAHYVPVRPVIARPLEPARATPPPRTRAPPRARARPPAGARASRAARSRARESRAPGPASGPAGPAARAPPPAPPPAPTYLPDALRSASPPPAKRLREGAAGAATLACGAVRRMLDAWADGGGGGGGGGGDAAVARTLAVARLLARRRNHSLGGRVEYFVRWAGAPLAGGTWEPRDALLRDVPGDVLAFDARHPRAPVAAAAVPALPPLPTAEPQPPRPKVEFDCARPGARARGGGNARLVRDARTDVPMPKDVDTALVCIPFAGGMELEVRWDATCRVYAGRAEAEADRRRRRAAFAAADPAASAAVFGAAGGGGGGGALPDCAMQVVPRAAVPQAQLWATLQRSADAHKAGGRRPIPFPRGLGQALPRTVAPPVPARDVARAPASWESYLLSVGMRCRDWERTLVPEMPGVSKGVERMVAEAAPLIRQAQLTGGREKGTRFDAGRVVSTPKRARAGDDAGGRQGADAKAGQKGAEGETGKRDGDGGQGKSVGGTEEDKKGEEAKEGGMLLREKDSEFKRALAEAMADAKAEGNGVVGSSNGTERVYDAVWGVWSGVASE